MVTLKSITNSNNNRELLRQKGQFWTPDWIARPMVKYVIENSNLVFDPAFGKGAFYLALHDLDIENNTRISFFGIDIDPQLVLEAKKNCSFETESCQVELGDFIENPPQKLFKSIVANPPYIRHHRLSQKVKRVTREISLSALGKTIDGRAGIHIYFLIQALRLLETGGKLSFIMPSDTCEGIFSERLWKWITKNYRLECVTTFAPNATPFPNVDTNPIIFFIKNASPQDKFIWVKVNQPQTKDLEILLDSNFKLRQLPASKIIERDVKEALTYGISRDPEKTFISKYLLQDFASVMRGIATGANDFFFLTKTEAKNIKIPQELLVPAIGRTRDIDGFYLTTGSVNELEKRGRPTLLFSPDSRSIEEFPPEVGKYLKLGESKGLPYKSLISSRKPWYKMEKRVVPPFLFAYLGRRNARFVRNLAGMVPLTGFLCVYPRSNNPEYIDKLWNILKHPDTIKNLSSIGKSYGSGAIKIEPRSLEKLPIPESLVEQYDINKLKYGQIPMMLRSRSSSYNSKKPPICKRVLNKRER